MLTNIIILSAVTWGIAQLFDEGMILGGIGHYIHEEFSPQAKWMLKPVILCPPCMASIWGTAAAVYLGYGPMQWLTLVLATAGLNFVIVNR